MTEQLSSDRLQETQAVMESRYGTPYNWLHPAYSIRWAHKTGLCRIITSFLKPEDRILDVGSGDGWYTARFADVVAEANGLDLSERATTFAKLIVPKATFTIGSAQQLPFPDGRFDAVTCIQMLEHLTEEGGRQALQEFRRVLAPGGRMIISVPSTLRPLSKAHLRHYTIEQLRVLLQPFGKRVTLVGHENANRLTLTMRKIFDNRFWFLPGVSKWFYEQIYFRSWNRVPAEKGNNLVAVVET